MRTALNPPLLSVLVPVYNERATLEALLLRVLAVPVDKEVVVVDDGSRDGTREVLAELATRLPIRALVHERNRGKGAAIRTALAEARGEVVIIQDADLEYDPEDYPLLIAPIVRGETNVVYGSRYLSHENPLPLTHFKVAVLLLNAMANLLYGTRLTDEATCYKVFRASLLKSLPLRCERFEFCPEVTARVAKRGERILEVPIRYHYRTRAQGKKIGWRDGFEAIWTLLRYRFSD
ncbi:MAG: glycosyltransferase family 2 protein [Candidatus Eiseniibacteriota bacterium]